MGSSREKENEYLNSFYEKDKSQLLILYGRKHIGKTTIVKEFIHNKDYLYYLSREASKREQYARMAEELKAQGVEFQNEDLKKGESSEKDTVFFGVANHAKNQKLVFVIDEFEYFIKADPEFMEGVLRVMVEANVFVILISSSIAFVENSMISKMGQAAFAISGLLKIKEFTFFEIKEAFKAFTPEQCLETYGILGGVPGYIFSFDKTRSTKENICQFILTKNSFLGEEGMILLSRELREPAVYSSILSVLASGKNKLNDIYKATGFSRAKISVYLKNLIELELVEKVFSYDTAGRMQTIKGVYQISNNFTEFWFRFIYPNLSALVMIKPEEFYNKYIAKDLKAFCVNCLTKVCKEYMELLRDKGKLPINYAKSGVWLGKEGTIDFIGTDNERNIIAAFFYKESSIMNYGEYNKCQLLLKQARIKPKHCYLFAMDGFVEEIVLASNLRDDLHLVTLKKEIMD